MAREDHMPGPGTDMPSHSFTDPYLTPPGYGVPESEGPPAWGSQPRGRRPESAPSTPSSSPAASIDDQVRELARRRDAGLISYEQFAALKAEIFARS